MGKQPSPPMALGNMRSLGPRGLDVTCKSCGHAPPSTWTPGLTRSRCRRSGRACGAPNAATWAPACGRTGRSCAACHVNDLPGPAPASRTKSDSYNPLPFTLGSVVRICLVRTLTVRLIIVDLRWLSHSSPLCRRHHASVENSSIADNRGWTGSSPNNGISSMQP
jgi:hypothetical protein